MFKLNDALAAITAGYVERAELEGAKYFTVWFSDKFLDNFHVAVTYARYPDPQLTKTDWSLYFDDTNLVEEHHGHDRSKRRDTLEKLLASRLRWKGFFKGFDGQWYAERL